MSLRDYENRFSSLRMNTRGSGGAEKSPHKVAMLLAVMDLVEQKVIPHNRIYFDQPLRDAFAMRFNQLASQNDRNNPHLPYFHLRSSEFWHHHLKPGKTEAYRKLGSASGPGVIQEHIAYVQLDDELFEYFSNQVSRDYLKSALMETLAPEARRSILNVGGKAWDWLECEALVQDYFSMLEQEVAGQKYSKAEHLRALMLKLRGRSKGSIEFKHGNVSAILLELGQPYIKGYKPASNYQAQLREVVLAHIAAEPQTLEIFADKASQSTAYDPQTIDWNTVLDLQLPEYIPGTSDVAAREYIARKPNYVERERNNRLLGEQGEQFVLDYERFRLKEAGRPDLAKEIRWVSRDEGDGAGYDIQSFSVDREEELFIEVKTTIGGKYQPFFISDNELSYSKEQARQYSLYRVYDFKSAARLFRLDGAVDRHVKLQAKNYVASFRR